MVRRNNYLYYYCIKIFSPRKANHGKSYKKRGVQEERLGLPELQLLAEPRKGKFLIEVSSLYLLSNCSLPLDSHSPLSKCSLSEIAGPSFSCYPLHCAPQLSLTMHSLKSLLLKSTYTLYIFLRVLHNLPLLKPGFSLRYYFLFNFGVHECFHRPLF